MYREEYIKNLRDETLKQLELYKKTPSDIIFVTDGFNAFTFNDFLELSNFTYDSGYGGAVVSLNLKIVGDNWWFERYEYDGLESWSYKEIPIISKYPDKPDYKMVLLDDERQDYSWHLWKRRKNNESIY